MKIVNNLTSLNTLICITILTQSIDLRVIKYLMINPMNYSSLIYFYTILWTTVKHI